jgi:uncharacterized circularly permuted ATP-grasp superfamily protein
MMDPAGFVRPAYWLIVEHLRGLGIEELKSRQFSAERSFMSMGITFNVYGEGTGVERVFPFDIIPRIIPWREWEILERGLQQRVLALNHFIDDVYHGQLIMRDGVVPRETVLSSPGYLRPCAGLNPPKGVWCHICGSDLIKHDDGRYYVLEDNLRVPSGVSYMLGNREVMKRTFPLIFENLGVQPVYDYSFKLLEMLQSLSPAANPVVVLLTPGVYNSAYFEHAFLAQQMGVQLVEGRDLVVDNGDVCVHTTKGMTKVDVIYRRLDDTYLDPLAFNPDSQLGVPGLFEAYRKGRVAMANAPGSGVADDKVIYAYVPGMIKYYLDEDPVLPNVPTYICEREMDRTHVLANLEKMVVKMANQSGGYGMLIGPQSTKAQQREFALQIKSNPRDYIAQPVMQLSRVPTIVDDHLEGRHVDLRPFILYGENVYVTPGGLTRVALKKGSLVVNSSQGGGSKDTWVLRKEEG